jgi:hypothetical protein
VAVLHCAKDWNEHVWLRMWVRACRRSQITAEILFPYGLQDLRVGVLCCVRFLSGSAL